MTSSPALAASVVAFLPVAVTLVLVPGVNNLVVLRETVAHGRAGGWAAIGGTSVGILGWSAAVGAGLGAIAADHPRAFTCVQLVGAALLVGGGVRGCVRVLMRPTGVAVQVSSGGGAAVGPILSEGRAASFRSAAVTSLANPRCPVTAVSVLPQFVAPGSAAAVTTLALGGLWTLLAGVWNVVGELLADRGRGVLTRPRARRVVEGLSAAALVAVGLSVASAV
ncbi:MAG TPA: LysE family translocator [Humibacillus sp.]|nr:LysE family translocator [Humibacillus sp.]